jgi:hypothetical protein
MISIAFNTLFGMITVAPNNTNAIIKVIKIIVVVNDHSFPIAFAIK